MSRRQPISARRGEVEGSRPSCEGAIRPSSRPSQGRGQGPAKSARAKEGRDPRQRHPAEHPTTPAFYALAPGAWRDYVTLLHPPYLLWHLSYVVLGAALASEVRIDRLAGTLVAFFLALGVETTDEDGFDRLVRDVRRS